MTRYLHVRPFPPSYPSEGGASYMATIGKGGDYLLPVGERYFTIQGEGHWTGTPAWFIRLQGCTVGCSWCDSKHTWDSVKPNISVEELRREIPYDARHVVVTGGEPFEHNIEQLLWVIHLEGRRVQIETSGTAGAFGPGWITLSPKRHNPPTERAIRNASEIKQVVTCADDIKWMEEEILPNCSQWIEVCLQPVSNGNRAMNICIEACKAKGYRLSMQVHKLMGIR